MSDAVLVTGAFELVASPTVKQLAAATRKSAAVIPPLCYAKPQLADKANVGATANLLKATEAQVKPPRLVQASVLTAETPVNPYDNHGKHKVEAEAIVRASHLDWVILRLGGVLTADGRLQTVDVLGQTLLTETANRVGWKRYPLRVIAPAAREFLKRRSPCYGQPPGYGSPWEAVRPKWGAPENDGKVS